MRFYAESVAGNRRTRAQTGSKSRPAAFTAVKIGRPRRQAGRAVGPPASKQASSILKVVVRMRFETRARLRYGACGTHLRALLMHCKQGLWYVYVKEGTHEMGMHAVRARVIWREGNLT